MQITFDEYDNMLKLFDQIKIRATWPELRQIQLFAKSPEKWILYCCYIYEKAPAPTTKEEQERKRALFKFINSNLFFRD